MRRAEASYEVQYQDGGRWVIDSVHDRKGAAVSKAEGLAGSKRYEAVRVLEEKGEGSRGKVVFERECEVQAPPLTIAPINDAPLCKKLVEFTQFPARKTAGRLLRAYLNHHAITAFELMNDYSHLRELERMEDLVNQAVHRIANIQARASGGDAPSRVDALYQAAAELKARAEATPDVASYVEALREGGIAGARAAIARDGGGKLAGQTLSGAIARYLHEGGDWGLKIKLVGDLAAKETAPESVVLIDELLAEILDGAVALQEVLGSQRDLADALAGVGALSGGKYKLPTERAKTGPLGVLNDLLGRLSLPLTQEVLLERVATGLGGIQPLTREGKAADSKALSKVIKAVTSLGGLRGGIPIAEAATRRIRIVMGDTRDLTFDEGVAKVLEHLPTQAVKLGYLLDLSASESGTANKVPIFKALHAILQQLKSLRDLVPADTGTADLMQAISELNDRLKAGFFPADITDLILKRLAKLAQSGGQPAPAREAPAAAAPAPAAPPQKPAASKADGVNRKRFPAGSYIFRQGDRGDEAYFVDGGQIEIVVEKNGREEVIATAERGDILGEMALIDRKPRMASARATADTVLLVIPEESFRARLEKIAEVDRLILLLLNRYVERLRAQATG